MSFAHNELGWEYQHNNTKVGSNINEINNIERQNCFNAKILDSTVDDNKEKFIELISQIANNDSDPNKTLIMTKYKFYHRIQAMHHCVHFFAPKNVLQL